MSWETSEALENLDPRAPGANSISGEQGRQDGIAGMPAKPGAYPETLPSYITYPNGSPAKRFGWAIMGASFASYLNGQLPAKIGNDEQLNMATTYENAVPPERLTGDTLATPLVSVSPTANSRDVAPPSQLVIKGGMAQQKAKGPLNPSDMLTLLETGDVYSW